MIIGGLLGVKMDKKAKMTSSTCSSEVYPRMHDNMVIMCLPVLEKMVVAYGGVFVGVWQSSMMKVWNIYLILTRHRVIYKSNRSPIDRGV